MALLSQTLRPITPPPPAVVPAQCPASPAALESPSALQRAGYALSNPWKNFLLPARFLKWLMTTSRSPLLAESRIRPGGWRSMEIIYANENPVDLLDGQALRDNPLSMGSRNRQRLVTDKLTELILDYVDEPQVIMLGVGAGPGNHIQTAIKQSQIDSNKVTAYLIDRDDDAFEFGRTQARRAGIGDSVHFIKGDARQIEQVLPDVSPHIVKLVGIIEYLTDAELSELLQILRRIMTPGASLLTHGLVDVYGTRQFLLRVFDLKHYVRTAGHLESLLRAAGFRPVDCLREPTGIYPVITALRD